MLLLKSKNIIMLGFIAFLVMSFWSLLSMSMDMNGHMINCPLMNGLASFCQMSVSEHINQWQQFFTLVREKSLLLSLFVFLLVALLIVDEKVHDTSQRQLHHNYFYWNNPEIKLFDYLVLAFSNGLIHSKIYA